MLTTDTAIAEVAIEEAYTNNCRETSQIEDIDELMDWVFDEDSSIAMDSDSCDEDETDH